MASARGLIWAASVAVALGSAAPASAAIRYTTPTSPTGNLCSSRSPCEIHKAIEQAADGDQVIVAPGTYQLSKGIAATKSLNIHGPAGRARPRLVSSDSSYVLSLNSPAASTVSDLELEGDGQAFGGVVSSGPITLSRLVVIVNPFGAAAISTSDDAVLRDTVAWAQGGSGSAVVATNKTLRVRNVTAIATASGSRAIDAVGRCLPGPTPNCDPALSSVTVDVKNTIARGGQYDISASGDFAADPATVNLSYSNYRPSMVQLAGGTAAVNDQGHNQSATPAFADPLSGDFHQLSSSPTVDAGTADPDNGPTDLDGNARALGAAPDIGEDEFVPPAPPPGGGTGGGGGGGVGGGGSGGGGGGGADTTPPAFLAARMTNATFAVDQAGHAETVVSARAVKLGTAFVYTLSEPARVLFAVEQKQPGRMVGRTCRKPTRKIAHKKACARFVRRGAFAQDSTAGANRRKWSGKLGKRALKPGSYRVTLTAKDAAGNVSKIKRLKFRVIRR